MHVPSDIPKAPLSELFDTRRIAETEIAPGHAARNVLRPLWSDAASEQWSSEMGSDPMPAIRIVGVPDVELGSNFLPHSDDAPVLVPGVQPRYVGIHHELGLVPKPVAANRLRLVDEPAFCVSHFNMRIYGHFLVEVLPKILLALALRESGVAARIAFPSDAGRVSGIVKALCPAESLLLYESKTERIRLRASLHPSMMFYPQMHELFVALVKLLLLRMGVTQGPAIAGRRVFLSRQNWRGLRTLTNEAELFEVAAGYGFQLVHPQELPWLDQVRMFAGVSHVVGAYSSALHGTIFSPAEAKIVSLGRVNYVQDGISLSLGHSVGYINPCAGECRPFDKLAPKRQNYEIDPAELRARLDFLEREHDEATP